MRKALEVLILNKVDLIICEYFRNILEMEWAIEVALEYGIPVAATMCIGPVGDESGVGVGECAVRMAKAGALLVGVNCLFDPFICLEVLKTMKVALDAFELTPYLMAQPLGYRVPDGGSFGWVEIPEFPFSVEPRQITRWEARKWARQAFELGVRYIGGCCGFEPYHIRYRCTNIECGRQYLLRAMAEELADVRGGLPEASSKSDHDLAIHRSLEEKGLKRYKNKVKRSIRTSKQKLLAGQPGVLDEPPASHRSTSLHSSLLPVRPSSHTPGSPQLILIRLFGQVRIIKIFLNIYCHSATFSASPKGSSLLLGHAGPVVASQLPLWSRRACVATNLG